MPHIFSKLALINHSIFIEQAASSPSDLISSLSLILHFILIAATWNAIFFKRLLQFNQKFTKNWFTSQIYYSSIIPTTLSSFFYHFASYLYFLFRHRTFHRFALLIRARSLWWFSNMWWSLDWLIREVVIWRTYSLRRRLSHNTIVLFFFPFAKWVNTLNLTLFYKQILCILLLWPSGQLARTTDTRNIPLFDTKSYFRSYNPRLINKTKRSIDINTILQRYCCILWYKWFINFNFLQWDRMMTVYHILFIFD